VKLLLVEDEENQRYLLKKMLTKEGYAVSEARTGKEALQQFEKDSFDLVLLDQRLPDSTGIDILRQAKEANPLTPIIIITAFANIQDAVNAMKQGAFDYLTKPIDPDELLLVINKAVETLRLKQENIQLKETLQERFTYEKIVYASARMEEVMSIVSRAATSNANVLVTGESGTGKELVAGAIHHLSNRRKSRFVIAHLAALPETLIEAELFGHEKGAFTGASRRRIGKFEYASEGTLFLDEIGELSQSIQTKLLRVIQDKKIVRLGSNEEIAVDVRLICATNKDIEHDLSSGAFREDLFYRLNVLRIHIPPLRERKADIPLLVDHFIRFYATKENKRIQAISDEAMNQLMKYHYPGNIRELGNIIERAIVLSRNEYIAKDDLPVNIARQTQTIGGKLNDAVERIETQMIKKALSNNKDNQIKAAEELGISERVLRYKLKKYGIKNR
jgi:DNA-binding NtrC family response regulator